MYPDEDGKQDGQCAELLRLLEVQSREVADLRTLVEALSRAVADISAGHRRDRDRDIGLCLMAAALDVARIGLELQADGDPLRRTG